MIKKDTFDKEKFKKELESNVRMLFRRKLEEATPQQIYQAVAYSVKDDIIDNWIETHKAYEKQDKKMVYYMSMEFLMGRALGNNMINLLCYDDVRETLEELDLPLTSSKTRSQMQHLVTVVLAVLQLVSLILLQHLDIQLTVAESVTVMVCSNRKSRTVIR